MKKNRLRVFALIVCLAFLMSAAPGLRGTDQKAVKSSTLTTLKSTFRVLGYLFPVLSPLTDLIKSSPREKELIDQTNIPNLLPIPTSDDPSLPPPRTKD